MLPLTNTPILEAPPIPPKKPKGIDITSAHGHDTTKNVNALYIHSIQSAPFKIIGGIIANKTAVTTKFTNKIL